MAEELRKEKLDVESSARQLREEKEFTLQYVAVTVCFHRYCKAPEWVWLCECRICFKNNMAACMYGGYTHRLVLVHPHTCTCSHAVCVLPPPPPPPEGRCSVQPTLLRCWKSTHAKSRHENCTRM